MRRISLNEVTDDMTLAKPIYQGTKLILQTGVAGIPKYKEKLNNVGIFPYMSTILSLMISQFLTWYVNRPEKNARQPCVLSAITCASRAIFMSRSWMRS